MSAQHQGLGRLLKASSIAAGAGYASLGSIGTQPTIVQGYTDAGYLPAKKLCRKVALHSQASLHALL